MSCFKGDFSCFKGPDNEKSFPYINEYGFSYALWSFLVGGLVIQRFAFQTQYGLAGMSNATRILAEVLTIIIQIYAATYTGYLNDTWKLRKGGVPQALMIIGAIIISISVIGFASGLDAQRNVQSGSFLLFSVVSVIGEAFYITGLRVYQIKVCKDNVEYTRLNFIYTLPWSLIGGIFFAAALPAALGTVAAAIVSIVISVASTILFFRFCRAEFRTGTGISEEQQPILGTLLQILSHPLGQDLMVINFAISLIVGFAKPSILWQFNYDMLDTVSQAAFGTLIFGFVIIIITLLLNPVMNSKFSTNEWDLGTTLSYLFLAIGVCDFLGFAFSSTLNYDYGNDAGVSIYLLTFLVTSCCGYLGTGALTLIVRKGCLSDLVSRGVDSFGFYTNCLNIMLYFGQAVTNVLALCFLSTVDYKQYDDDKLDDKITTRYGWTDNTLWYLRFITFFIPGVVSICTWYYLSRYGKFTRAVSAYLEEEATKIQEAKKKGDEEVEIERNIDEKSKNPMHEDGAEDSNSSTSTSSKKYHRENLCQFTLAEIAILDYSDTVKVQSHLNFMRWMNRLILIVSLFASIFIFAFMGMCIQLGYLDWLPLMVLAFIFTSMSCFYELLRYNPIKLACNLIALNKLGEEAREEEQIRSQQRKKIRQLMAKANSINEEGDETLGDKSQRTGTHMTSDKIIKFSLLMGNFFVFLIFLVLIAFYAKQ